VLNGPAMYLLAGGGGGGYFGGGAGGDSGGGGGSGYAAGMVLSPVLSGGNGLVVITYSDTTVPEPWTGATVPLALGAILLVRRLRKRN